MSDYTRTPNLGLYKPNYALDVGQWGSHLNLNSDVLDTALSSIAPLPPGQSIQDAVNALPADGGVIVLADDTTYVVTSGIFSSKPNVRITAPSWNTIIQRGPTFSGAVLQLDGDGCLIEGVTFDGNGAVAGAISSGACEAAIAGANSRITNCQFINSSATMNISCAGAGCRVDHCTITGMGISLSTQRGFGVWAVNNVQVFIEHNRITGTGIEAIGLNGPGSVANGNIISRCHCYSGGPGGQIWAYPNTMSEAGAVVSNNYIGQGQDVSSGGIELNGNNVTCTGNTVVNQYLGGIQLNGGQGIVVSGNTVLNTGLAGGGNHDGIVVLAGVTDFIIVGNRVGDDQATPTMRWPIVVNAGASDRYTISGNLLGPNSDPNGRLVDGGTGTTKFVQGNTGSDTVVPVAYSTAALTLGSVNQIFHLQNGGTTTITSIAAGAGVKGSLRVALPNAVYVFSAGNNIGNTVTTTANVPLIMACDETGKWWLR